MRGLRIAAFLLASILACVVLSHMFSWAAVPEEDSQTDLPGEVPDAAPTMVPAPPPLPGEPALHPVKTRPAQERIAQAQPAPAEQPDPSVFPPDASAWESSTPETLAVETLAIDAQPVIRQGNEFEADAAALPLSAVEAEGPAGPVIVVPQERPREASRRPRWLKAVGRALGIGGPKDPVEQAFQ